MHVLPSKAYFQRRLIIELYAKLIFLGQSDFIRKSIEKWEWTWCFTGSIILKERVPPKRVFRKSEKLLWRNIDNKCKYDIVIC